MPRAALLTTLLLLGACSANPPIASLNNTTATCAEPRPQVCTMEYDPVCGQLAAGTHQDYSSPCNACAHDEVRAYRRGSCAGAGE
jgi:hypothetical protein